MVETMIAAPGDDEGERAGEVAVAEGKAKKKRVVRAGGEGEEYLGLRVTAAEFAEIERLMGFAPDCTKSTVVRALLRIGMRVVKDDPKKLGEAMIVKRGR